MCRRTLNTLISFQLVLIAPRKTTARWCCFYDFLSSFFALITLPDLPWTDTSPTESPTEFLVVLLFSHLHFHWCQPRKYHLLRYRLCQYITLNVLESTVMLRCRITLTPLFMETFWAHSFISRAVHTYFSWQHEHCSQSSCLWISQRSYRDFEYVSWRYFQWKSFPIHSHNHPYVRYWSWPTCVESEAKKMTSWFTSSKAKLKQFSWTIPHLQCRFMKWSPSFLINTTVKLEKSSQRKSGNASSQVLHDLKWNARFYWISIETSPPYWRAIPVMPSLLPFRHPLYLSSP